MHELSIAMSIIDIAAAEAERRGARIEAVHLKVGALSGVVTEALASAYELARENSPVAGARLVIEEVPVVIYCDVCRSEQPILSIQEFCCPQCGAFTANVVRGRELEVVALELEA
ncbi:MAG: hydrogenase maturation nickel metallochaperone HypA [Deltaproteobacteria bacterium]